MRNNPEKCKFRVGTYDADSYPMRYANVMRFRRMYLREAHSCNICVYTADVNMGGKKIIINKCTKPPAAANGFRDRSSCAARVHRVCARLRNKDYNIIQRDNTILCRVRGG